MSLISPVEVAPVAKLGTLHFLAIGGAGMAPIAMMYAAGGSVVSGCDREVSDAFVALHAAGIATSVGHDVSHLDGVDTLVYSTAINPSNSELYQARGRGMRVWHRSAALAALMLEKVGIAVSGTHGKTTTSAMIAHILTTAKADPSYVLGAPLQGGSAYRVGAGEHFVIEADESDGSFLQYPAQIAVITNIEADHLDNWETPAAYQNGFTQFVAGATIGQIVTHKAVFDQLAPANPERFCIAEPLQFDLQVLGEHNQQNAALAFAVCNGILGLDAALVRQALYAFRGAARRFELVGSCGSVDIYDDYAHHPTEVTATIAAARRLEAPRLVICYQPHLFSRTQQFATDFAAALAAADVVVVMDVYPSREEPIPGVSGELISKEIVGSQVYYAPDATTALDTLARLIRPGDLVLTMGAGDVTKLGSQLLNRLREIDFREIDDVA